MYLKYQGRRGGGQEKMEYFPYRPLHVIHSTRSPSLRSSFESSQHSIDMTQWLNLAILLGKKPVHIVVTVHTVYVYTHTVYCSTITASTLFTWSDLEHGLDLLPFWKEKEEISNGLLQVLWFIYD